jgi:hypothetical protein
LTDVHLETRLRMSGAIPPHTVSVCMACYVETFNVNGVVYTGRFEGRYRLHLQGLMSVKKCSLTIEDDDCVRSKRRKSASPLFS